MTTAELWQESPAKTASPQGAPLSATAQATSSPSSSGSPRPTCASREIARAVDERSVSTDSGVRPGTATRYPASAHRAETRWPARVEGVAARPSRLVGRRRVAEGVVASGAWIFTRDNLSLSDT